MEAMSIMRELLMPQEGIISLGRRQQRWMRAAALKLRALQHS